MMAVHDLRKHVAWYLKGFPVGGGTRAAFMKCENVADVQAQVDLFDPDIEFPLSIADKPRGRVRFAKKVHLPQNWLDSREMTPQERADMFEDDPMDASYQDGKRAFYAIKNISLSTESKIGRENFTISARF